MLRGRRLGGCVQGCGSGFVRTEWSGLPGRHCRCIFGQLILSGGNNALMKMFNLINIGERSGSGVPLRFNTWKDQKWKEPVIEERFDLDRTILILEKDIAIYIGLSPARTRAILAQMEGVEIIGGNTNRRYKLKK